MELQDPGRICVRTEAHGEGKDGDFSDATEGGRQCFLPEPGLLVWDGQLKPAHLE